jgi:hypothetical protein
LNLQKLFNQLQTTFGDGDNEGVDNSGGNDDDNVGDNSSRTSGGDR